MDTLKPGRISSFFLSVCLTPMYYYNNDNIIIQMCIVSDILVSISLVSADIGLIISKCQISARLISRPINRSARPQL